MLPNRYFTGTYSYYTAKEQSMLFDSRTLINGINVLALIIIVYIKYYKLNKQLKTENEVQQEKQTIGNSSN
jgi:hypothetical protein